MSRSLAGTCGGAASAAVLHPERKPVDMEAVASEVYRLRAEKATAKDPQLAAAISSRIATLSNQWCELAHARGMKPPGDGFDPFRASDEELRSAVLWTQVGNAFPVRLFQEGVEGTARYERDLAQAYVARSPALLARLVEANKAHPERLMPLVARELARLGDRKPCSPNDTLESLYGRLTELQLHAGASARLKADEEARKQKTIGLDGRVGTLETIEKYEMEQLLVAANPGTALGGIMAGVAAARGGTVEDMRAAGQAGSALQNLAAIGTTPDLSHLGIDSPFRWGFTPPPKPTPGIR